MTLPEIIAELSSAASYADLQAAKAALDAASGQQAKGIALKDVAAKVAICRKELGMDPGLFAAA
jgi:hypothetical protein